jgi:hypothetical protein
MAGARHGHGMLCVNRPLQSQHKLHSPLIRRSDLRRGSHWRLILLGEGGGCSFAKANVKFGASQMAFVLVQDKKIKCVNFALDGTNCRSVAMIRRTVWTPKPNSFFLFAGDVDARRDARRSLAPNWTTPARPAWTPRRCTFMGRGLVEHYP